MRRSDYHPGLHLMTLLVGGATFFLIIAGALVTSNDAGLAVPDWPLSFGQVMPEMTGGIFYEHGHRLVAASVGLLTVLLNVYLWRVESRRWVRRLGLLSLGAVILQGLLGGLTVLLFLPPPVSVLHAGLAQFFFCLVVVLVVATSQQWSGIAAVPRDLLRGALRRQGARFKWAAAATGAVYLQLILGAVVRHSGMVEGTKGAELIPWTVILHVLGAVLVTGTIARSLRGLFKPMEDRGVLRLVYAQLSLLVIQIFLGLGALLIRLDAAAQVQPTPLRVSVGTAHVSAGALLLMVSLALTLRLCLPGETGREGAGVASSWAEVTS